MLILLELILHKFYAASISVALDGSMLVASNRDRLMAWGMIFCFLAALSLTSFLLWRRPHARKLSIVVLILSLGIPIFVMPSAIKEYIHVSREQITIDAGLWYMPSTTVVTLNSLKRLSRDSKDYMVSNLIGDDYVTWHFEREDGSVQKLVLNDFFSAHSMAIAHYIRDRGYQVEWLEIRD
jgi:hypothetical protein